MPTVILMIVQPGERNVFDQTLLIYKLDEMSSGPSDWNRMIRLPYSMRLYYLIDGADCFEVSVIYYRSMYGPEDFMTEDLSRSNSRDARSVMNKEEFEEIKSTWVDILDFDGGRSSLACQLGTNHKSSTSYVLKPQVSCCHRLEDSTYHPDSVRVSLSS
ncbi:hypothetical protein BY996DRAFT_6518747 [Phakopsora pachyrhizi]|uniref:Glutathione synthase substrate-binding domain-containing protein n=1 Tax=Phakopsora pachyrhizi TaxID=170000 RepID=A0AAV0ASJ0_PHAPC|nr:hypothetical protein BY996DRAFT_6518747 [Phakopsora pachyrhizi]CAH7671560.1 hypothetical protein PPACK8108_LOCUS6349 [Phakopsora pachyrhizi]